MAKIMKEDVLAIEPSKIETVDFALFEWVDKTMDIHATTNKGFKKIPVLWVSGERSYQIKNNKELRDAEGSLIFPVMSVERTAINKDPSRRGSLQAFMPPVNKYNNFTYYTHSRIKQDKTANFASTNSKRTYKQDNFRFDNPNVVEESYFIKAPTYIDMSYLLTLRAEYQQQMNEMLQPFITKTGNINSFLIVKDGHHYEAFMQPDFSFSNNVSAVEQEERIYQTAITINVLGYLYGQDTNDDSPKIFKQEGVAKIKITGEKEMLSEKSTKKV
jgi:hypothetical protein